MTPEATPAKSPHPHEPPNDSRWQFWIDVGGTFTDCIARRPDGHLRTHKLLSTGVYRGKAGPGSAASAIRDPSRCQDPQGFFRGWRLILTHKDAAAREPVGDSCRTVSGFDAATGTLTLDRPLEEPEIEGTEYELRCGEEAPVIGIRWLLGIPMHGAIGPVQVRLGTTRGTNALLERTGASAALITTRGFADILAIGHQNRPSLFERCIRRPARLYQRVVELDERIASDGAVLRALDPGSCRAALMALKGQGIRSLAICLLNAYRNDAHERRAEQVASDLGFDHVSRSSRVNPLQKIVSRGETTVVDAYLSPVIREYIASVAASMPEGTLELMTSAGALASASGFAGKDCVLSGPAGGVVGCAHVGMRAGFNRLIGFDMGGTSTDICRFDGEYERCYEMELPDPDSGGALRIAAPMLAIETVAAGGGSVCAFDGQKPVVGPQSAGANPGPACYGRGGPLTVTDMNLFLGRILPDQFPFALDRDVVGALLERRVEEIAAATGKRYAREELAQGYLDIANANMIAPIRKVSIARGYDPRDHVLVCFGGAGGQHACAIAAELGMRRVLLHRMGGVLSALGTGMADRTLFAARDLDRTLDRRANIPLPGPVTVAFDQMELELRAELARDNVAAGRIRPPRRLLDLRFKGQESCLTVEAPDDGDWIRAFQSMHERIYGFSFEDRAVEARAARIELSGAAEKPVDAPRKLKHRTADSSAIVRAWFRGARVATAVHHRDLLEPGDRIPGPAIILESVSTIVIEPGWIGSITGFDDLVLEQGSGAAKIADRSGPEMDPIELELFNNHFASIAEEMGAALQKTALSTNVKERLDFSCAIFDREGGLVVNAPHIPVHLGAMAECVKRLMRDIPDMEPGDVYVTNDPYRGGSHLPDVTVVNPVFAPCSVGRTGREAPLFFTASRAHHAEIGGVAPGSMAPFARNLAEEGVLIRAFRLVHRGESDHPGLEKLLTSGLYPSRSPADNVADVEAQTAANQEGANRLLTLVNLRGPEVVLRYMKHIQKAAEAKMRRALAAIPEGRSEFSDQLDDGSIIRAAITIRHTATGENLSGEATIDFSGTGPVHPGNLNANPAIVASAVIYCFRCLINEAIPLNAGLLEPLRIVIPENCLLNPIPSSDPKRCPAVGGGNVETSQRIVDVLFGALNLAAASQGTMNNFIFGRGKSETRPGFGYYETIGGGAGAGPGFHGADAVHTHMTNTRLTDPEVLEDRYPVRVRELSIRRGSGGAGRWCGGNGIIREIEFLEPLEVSLLTSRRSVPPYGLNGGEPGSTGKNTLIRHGSGRLEELPGSAHVHVEPGDILRLETPGGGGWGKSSSCKGL